MKGRGIGVDDQYALTSRLRGSCDVRCQPWRAKRRLVNPGSHEATLLSERLVRVVCRHFMDFKQIQAVW